MASSVIFFPDINMLDMVLSGFPFVYFKFIHTPDQGQHLGKTVIPRIKIGFFLQQQTPQFTQKSPAIFIFQIRNTVGKQLDNFRINFTERFFFGQGQFPGSFFTSFPDRSHLFRLQNFDINKLVAGGNKRIQGLFFTDPR
jgi:hypothetical protein